MSKYVNLYATRDSQTKFEGNHTKNGRATAPKVVEEEQEEKKEEKKVEEKTCQHRCRFSIHILQETHKPNLKEIT